MDVEMSEQPVASGSGSGVQARVTVTNESPFDLEAVMANYSGRDLALRLQFVASRSHSLAGPALRMAMEVTKRETLDVALYEQLHGQFVQFVSALESGRIEDPVAVTWAGSSDQPIDTALDREWLERTRREADNSLQKLEVELKGYQTNLIKESIRMGFRDLARMQQRCGNLTAALTSYQRSREQCVNAEQALEVCLAIVQLCLELHNYGMLRNWVAKAEGQLEHVSQADSKGKSKSQAVNLPGMQQTVDPAQLARDKDRQATADRLAVAAGIAHLGNANFEKAARAFTSVSKEALESSTKGHFVPASDIALYAVVTSLACFSRSEARRRLVENGNMRPYLDAEPYLRDILRAYESNDFKQTFALLEHHSARQHLDTFLSPHVATLLSQIRTRALLSYFAPFATLSLDRFARAFGTTREALTPVLVDLITRDKLEARIDLIDGTLVKREQDPRQEAFERATETGQRVERDVLASRFRMKLVEAGLIVKAPKSSSSSATSSSKASSSRPQQAAAEPISEGV